MGEFPPGWKNTHLLPKQSTWQRVRGEVSETGYNRWPNPFNAIKQIDVLACNPEFLARIEFYGQASMEFFWTNFLPSPLELFRKGATGQFKCGFYHGPKVKSPFDYVSGKGTGVVIGGIIAPLTTGLFYWWAAATAWDALNTWSSIMNAQANCDADANSAIMRDGHAFLRTASSGSPVFYIVTHDPNNWAVETSGFITPPPGFRQAFASIFLWSSGTAETLNFRVRIHCVGAEGNWIDGSLAPGEATTMCPGYWGVEDSPVQVEVELLNDPPEAFGQLNFICQRFRVGYSAVEPTDKPPFNVDDYFSPTADPTGPCFQRFPAVVPS